MDMNISMRDKKILLMFLGLGIFAGGYFFGYRPQMEEAESIQASNVPLQERLNDLLDLAESFIWKKQILLMQRLTNIRQNFRQISVLKMESCLHKIWKVLWI